ncbi:EKC/KEOPS complex subunit LAGE3-like [Tupaia chinensis]|uniref:EKC/KEOPS complex subunit LAGE3-like n=1 Tax=Tupaia chinensis TaxID=246437 RepID=UPI0003C91FF6|nr:EKC/KEOPS complex subunit LAGE3-like [Tupaia chinensis]
MQAPQDDAGAGGTGDRAEAQGGSRNPGDSGSAGSSEGKGSLSGPGHLSDPRGLEGRSGCDGQGAHGGPESQSGPAREGAVGEVAVATPQCEQAAHAPGSRGDAGPMARGSRSRLLEFTLIVPFQSPLEADMAHRSLAPDTQRQPGVVQKEFTVNGSTLTIRWTAEDPVLFRISINSFLDRLSLVVRNIQRLGLPASLKQGRGKGPES